MEIQQSDEGNKGFFKAMDNAAEAGVMAYTWKSPNVIAILYTEVNPSFAGKNIGKQLVMASVKYARENDIKIIPFLCSFAKSIFEKDTEIQDVLFKAS